MAWSPELLWGGPRAAWLYSSWLGKARLHTWQWCWPGMCPCRQHLPRRRRDTDWWNNTRSIIIYKVSHEIHYYSCTVWCPKSVRCPNSVTHKNSCLTIWYSKQTTQETSGIILENIYFIVITNGSYKGVYYTMKNAVKSSVCEIEPFRWLIHQWLT